MKKIFLMMFNLAFVAISISFAQSNAIDKLFAEKTLSDDFNYVSVSDKMFGSISKSDDNDPEIKEILASLKGLKILKTKINPLDFFSSSRSKLNNSDYEELMSIKENGSNIMFFITGSSGNTVKELVLLVGNKQEAVLMSFTGNINLDKISKIGKILKFDGADKLDNLGKS